MTDESAPVNAGMADDSVMANSFRPIQSSIASTGMRPYDRRYDSLLNAPGARIAEDFLVNSRLRRGDAELGLSVAKYFESPALLMASHVGQVGNLGSRCVSLPAPSRPSMSLTDAVQRRRSVRRYCREAVPLEHVAAIIRAATGITARKPEQDGVPASALRSAPSGGALYPIDLHIAALNVTKLPRGLYVYAPHSDQLWQRGDDSEVAALLEAFALPGQVISEKQSSVIFLLVGRPWRSMRKYGDRGMRYVFLEAGAIAEHIHLMAVGLGLASVDCGSFYDDDAHEALGIDGVYEALIHTVFLGKPA